MDLLTTLSAGNSIIKIGKEIAQIVKAADKSPEVTKRVLLYLTASQAAVRTLGIERQRILSDVRKCDIEDKTEVDALWERLDTYLYQDNVRTHLVDSIRGLDKCREEIRNEAKGILWRKRNKEAAVKNFDATLQTLLTTLRSLTDNFYPGGSGMGIQTLMPIYNLIDNIRKNRKHWAAYDKKRKDEEIEAAFEEIGELAIQAISDSSHEDWIRTTGQIEALIAELQLAFSIQEIRKETNNLPIE